MNVVGADEIPEGKPKKVGTWGAPYTSHRNIHIYIYIYIEANGKETGSDCVIRVM